MHGVFCIRLLSVVRLGLHTRRLLSVVWVARFAHGAETHREGARADLRFLRRAAGHPVAWVIVSVIWNSDALGLARRTANKSRQHHYFTEDKRLVRRGLDQRRVALRLEQHRVVHGGVELVHRVALPEQVVVCLLYTSPSPRDATLSRMPSSA